MRRKPVPLLPLDDGPKLAGLKPLLVTEAAPGKDGPGWVHEIKYDGFRTLAEWGGGQCRLKSRNGADATTWFAEVAQSLATFGRTRCVVDGEVCVLDEYGRSDFDRLMTRALVKGYRPGMDTVVYCIFDLLVLDGKSVMELPLLERQRMLEALLAAKPSFTLRVQGIEEQGQWLYDRAVALGLEGIVSKRVDSTYRPGERCRHWVKRKRPNATPAQRFRRGPLKNLSPSE